MAKRRLQVGDLQAPGLRPAATPVDTYVPPAQESTISRLAGGLSKFNQNLSGLSDTLSNKYIQEQQALGEAAAREFANQGLTMGDLQREGKLPASQNPWARAAMEEQMGRVTADRWSEDMTAKLNANKSLEKSTSMEDFDRVWAEERQAWMKENGNQGWSRQFEAGFGARADAYQHQARLEHAQRIEKNTQDLSSELQFSETNKFVRDNIQNMSPAEIAKNIKDHINDPAVKLGRRQADVDAVAVRAVMAAALDNEDFGTQSLEILRHLTGDKGMTLGDTSFGVSAIMDAEKELSIRIQRKKDQDWEDARRERENRTRMVLSEALKGLQKDKLTNLDPYIGKVKDDWEAVAQLRQLKVTINNANFVTDEAVKNELHASIWAPKEGEEPVTEKTIIQHLNAGHLTSDDSLNLLNQLVAARSARVRDGASIYKDSNFEAIEGTIPRRFADGAGMTPAFAGDRVTNAIAMLRERWANLHSSGQADTMSDQQKLDWLQSMADGVVKLQRTIEGDDSGFLFTMDPAPAPVFQSVDDLKKRMPQNLVVPITDIDNALQGNGVSPGLMNIINTIGLRDEQEILEFFKSQKALAPQAAAKRKTLEKKAATKKKEE